MDGLVTFGLLPVHRDQQLWAQRWETSMGKLYFLLSCVFRLVRKTFGANSSLKRTTPSDLSPVVDAYEHALLSRYPRPRYMVGRGTTFMAALAVLPESIGDWVFSKMIKL